MDPGSHIASHHGATRLALDVTIVVGAILIWALLSHVNWSGVTKPSAAEDCAYFGRAGAHCTEQIENKDGDKSAHDQNCHSLGRAGRVCQSGPSSN
jgi:hypothetical protein